MNPKVNLNDMEGWVLATDDGFFLYKGNPNPEYDDMHLELFGTAAFYDKQTPLVFVTKWEASEKGKEWNALVHKKCKGVQCISKHELVHPVKVRIGIERKEGK